MHILYILEEITNDILERMMAKAPLGQNVCP